MFYLEANCASTVAWQAQNASDTANGKHKHKADAKLKALPTGP